MSTAFSFFLRLFLCFVGAKFLLHAISVEGRGYLVGLTIVLLGNVYWFSYLLFRDRTASLAEVNGTRPQSPVDAVPTVVEPQKNHAPPEA
jgi:hypothetical protein